MPVVELTAVKDAYVDEAAPDSNFGDEVELHVRSENAANKRAYIEFDMDQLPANFHDFDDPLSVIVQVVEESATERTIKLDEVTGSWEEATLTWNTQPSIGLEGIGSRTSNPDELSYDLLGLVSIIPPSGPFRVRLRDGTEGELIAAQQRLAAREHTTEAPPVFQIGYIAAEARELASSVTVRRSASEDLAAGLLPRLAGSGDLSAVVDVVYTAGFVATVTPVLRPLAVTGQACGVISRLFLEALEEIHRVSDEAGTTIEWTQEGETRTVRRIVQLVDVADGPAFSRHRSSELGAGNPGTRLRRGDAVLFAPADERWDPGAMVVFRGLRFRVAGVLAVERFEDEPVYREVGLRRLSTVTVGRAAGEVSTSP